MNTNGQAVKNRIKAANNRLKIGKFGVKIEQKGDRLYVRGTFPPKPDSDKTRPHQQRIALGLHANHEGVKLAEKKAKQVGIEIDAGTFNWEPYQKIKKTKPELANSESLNDCLTEFEKVFFQKRARNKSSETTFKSYLTAFNKLPGNKLTADAIMQAVLSTDPDSGTRRNVCIALNKLAKFAGIDVDLSGYRGKYSHKVVNPRELPCDNQIIENRELLPDDSSRWIYGMMATYGLRNHEVFLLELSAIDGEDNQVTVIDGKTQSRTIYPCHPEWVDLFNLTKVRLPTNFKRSFHNYSHKYLGARVTDFLSPQPIKPYNLRHCWARRSFKHGWPIEMRAALMGHSVEIHRQTYLAWIGQEPFREFFRQSRQRQSD